MSVYNNTFVLILEHNIGLSYVKFYSKVEMVNNAHDGYPPNQPNHRSIQQILGNSKGSKQSQICDA